MNRVEPPTSHPKPFPDRKHLNNLIDPHTARLYAYRGTSMFPTLREPCALEIEPYVSSTPRVGDVVVCVPPDHTDDVVHRITRVTSQGIYTKGDNAWVEDPWVLSAGDIVGRVARMWLDGRHHRLPGGWMGWVRYKLRRSLAKVVRRLVRLFTPVYRKLYVNGLFYRMLPAHARPRVIHFRHHETEVLRMVWFHKVIGTYDPDEGQWRIRPPFRLLVDPKLASSEQEKALHP